MGYSTDFTGRATITPPLNPNEIAYLHEFADSRRMNRPDGPYSTRDYGYTELGFDGYTTHRMLPASWVARQASPNRAKPLRVWLNHQHGAQLQSLPYDLVWCTTWQAEANEWIGPHLGLPELPHVPFEKLWAHRPDGTYFKTWEVVRWAQGRPFAWVDDEIGTADREYVADVHRGPALLHHVNPAKGLLPADFEALADWAASLETETAA